MLSKIKPKNFSTRLVLMTLLAGLIPILIFAVLMEVYGNRFHREVNRTIHQLGNEQWQRTEKVLRQMAEDSIRQKAVDVALQVKLYLKVHPEKTLKALQESGEFRKIAVQSVGKTGYTALDERPAGVTRFHHDPSIENTDLHRFVREAPQFWSIAETALGGKPSRGYYDWTDQDGKVRQKYMYVVPLSEKTADGASLNVVATAYVGEFTHPIELVRDIQGLTDQRMRTTVDGLIRSFTARGLLFMGMGLLVLGALACWSGVYFSKTLIRLKEATRKIINGDFNVAVQPSVSGDVGEFVQDFNTMIARLGLTTVSKRLLEESEHKFRTLAETTTSGILIYRDGLFVYANPAAERLIGLPSWELEKMHFWEIARHDFRVLLKETGRTNPGADVPPGTPQEICILGKDGKEQWVEVTIGATTLDGRPAGLMTIFDITGRRQVESELRESEGRYRAAIESSNDAVAIIRENVHVYVNNRYLQAFGYGATDEVIGKPVPEVVHPGDRDMVTELNNLRQAGNPAPSRYVFRGVKKTGEVIVLEASAARTFYNGEPVSLAYLRDVTERTRAEKALKAERQRFKTLTEHAPFGMAMIGKDGAFQYINPKFRELFGYDLEDIPDGRSWFRKAYPDPSLRSEVIAAWMRSVEALKSGEIKPVSFTVTSKDGKEKIINFMSMALETGDYLMTCEDVTEMLGAEKALRESEEKYRNLIETSLVGVYIVQDKEFKFVNRKFCEIYHASPEEIMGARSLLHKVHPEDRERVAEFLQKCTEGQPEETEYEFRILADDADIRTVKVMGTASSYRGSPAVIGTLLDVSREKILERQLLQSQKLETVGRLAGGIAHDFNNMLNIILGNAQLAKSFVAADHKVLDYCTSIEKAVFRASKFVTQLLAFSRQQLLELKVVDLNDTLHNFAKMVGRVIGENIDIKVVTEAALPFVKADAGQIDQILLNLVVNARDSMPGGGEIIIETSGRRLDEAYCRFHSDAKPGAYAVLAITDTGMGMDRDTVGKIFEPFFSRKRMGTGLGLSVVYGIVKQHNGFINVYSEVGKGTAFKVYLPSVAEDLEPEEAAAAHPGARGTETILVVEDEEPLRKIAAEFLESAGYRVLTAADGEEAVGIFRERCGEIDLALIDVVMPRLGGRETYEAMKRIRSSIRSLFMTGYSLHGIHTNFILEQGIDAIQKPYSFEDLTKRIREILDR